MARDLDDSRAAAMEATGVRLFRGERKLADLRTVDVEREQLMRGMDARADHPAVPRVTFTDPEIASVGLPEAAARAKGLDVIIATADPAQTARGAVHDFHQGALKLVGDREHGVLIGAVLVTPRAGEIVLAIKLRIPLKTPADVIHPFPGFNRVPGDSLHELAAKASNKAPHDPDVIHHNQWRSQ